MKAVFLDTDGILSENSPYNVDTGRIALCRGTGNGLRRWRRWGFA